MSEALRANAAVAAQPAEWAAHGLLVAIGCCALAVGVLVYVTDREAARAMLLPATAGFGTGAVFGAVGFWLPSFLHPFAFSLFTAAALPSGRAGRYGACTFWCAVNVAFELGQHPQTSAQVAEALRGSFGPTLLTQPLANYVLRGTFDGDDIVAIVVGALAAAVVLRLADRRWEIHHGT